MAKKLRNWCVLSMDWYKDRVLMAAGLECPAVFAVWPVLIAMAKEHSHPDDNPSGEFDVFFPDLAKAVCVDEATAEKALGILIEGEFVVASDRPLGVKRVTIPKFLKWNVPRGSKADYKRQDRLAENQFAGKKSLTGDKPSLDGDKQSPIPTPTPIPTLNEISSVSTDSSGREPDHSLRAEVDEVVDHWCQEWGKDRSRMRGKVFAARRNRIRIRLSNGWSVEDLKHAISGFKFSPWHTGENPDNRVYDSIDTLLRDDAQVEKGLELYEGRSVVPGGKAGERVEF